MSPSELTPLARAASWTRQPPSRPPSSRCAARATCGMSPSPTCRARACATVRHGGGTENALRCARRSRPRAGFKVRGDGGWETGNRWYPDVVLLDPCVLLRRLTVSRRAASAVLGAPRRSPPRLMLSIASSPRAGMRRWWRGATSSRTRRSRLGRGASPAPTTLRRRRCVRRMAYAMHGVLRRAVPARAVRLAGGGAAGPPRCVSAAACVLHQRAEATSRCVRVQRRT